MALTPLCDALAVVLKHAVVLADVEAVPLAGARDRRLAHDVIAPIDVPTADNSAMDGYAVRAGDLPGELPVTQILYAGAPAHPLAPRTAARVFTGAVIPEGADTVIMQEDALVQQDRVAILGCVTKGAHIRARGADIRQGAPVLEAGALLSPQHLGLLASLGLGEVIVRRRIKVGIISTGDELKQPGAGPLEPWQIYNSNAYQLAGLVSALGADPIVFDTCPDSPEVIGELLERAASEVDCIVSSGGVSVGDADYLREQIEARGVLQLWKLAIKPGKPLAFGHVNQTPIFGLPGNPVSAWVTFSLVVRPFLLAMSGVRGTSLSPLRRRARAQFTVTAPGTREEYLRVVITQQGTECLADLTGNQSSGVLSSVAKANALAVLPIGKTIEWDEDIDVIMLADLIHPPY
jgi:molybdopterin molybdotransferase